MSMHFAVEQWAPEYGTPIGPDVLEESQATVDVNAEVPAAEWAPVAPPAGVVVPDQVAFVDGVRRVDARVWVTSGRGTVHQGICASYGAGVVRCNGSASVVEARVERGLFCDAPDLVPLETRHGRYAVKRVGKNPAADPLSLALQGAMSDLEQHVSTGVPTDCLLVVDGPLRDRIGLEHAVGYIKTHHVSYLPAIVQDTIPALRAGERTPVILLGDRFRRWSWYLRLPGAGGHGWAGVVRCETNPDRSLAEVTAIADMTAILLPRFASAAHKDRRAPQNLYPIAGLERELRRRLGDAALLYRSLRSAADRLASGEPVSASSLRRATPTA